MPHNDRELEEALERLGFDDAPDAAHRDRLQEQLLSVYRQRRKLRRNVPLDRWRLIMKNPIAKLTAAGVVIAAVILGVHFGLNFPDGSNVLWAIEQSTEAHAQIETAHIRGQMLREYLRPDETEDREPIGFDIWARKGTDFESSDLRFETDDGYVIVVRGKTSFMYNPHENKVRIKPGRTISLRPWIGGRLFEILKEKATEWEVTYGEDQETGRQCAFVSCSYAPRSRSWWMAFDVETKLLVQFKQWHNVCREGPPVMSAVKIVYNEDLEDSLFEFQAPQGAEVIDMGKKAKQDE